MEEKQLEKSIGVLSHKIKNPLHSAVINLDVLRVKLKRCTLDEEIYTHLDIVNNEVLRLEKIILKYLEFLKKSDVEKAKSDLSKILDKV